MHKNDIINNSILRCLTNALIFTDNSDLMWLDLVPFVYQDWAWK